jgi:hypothetical protein
MKRRNLLALSGAALAFGSVGATRAQESKPFTSEQLDQLLAPIALYPDALLAQTLMAATYPFEVVQAARWSQANPNLKGDAAVNAVKNQDWDVSVKSLVAFPQVLAMMNSKLDWTQQVGDAMIGQQQDVAASIQRLRAKAAAAGNLKTTEQQKVTTQAATGGSSTIVIEPANPEVIYVPSYNPAWAYGPWPYPAYPPVYFPPPPYYGAALMSGMMFGVGVAAGAALFGGWNWGAGNTYVNVNKATNISVNNFDANRYRDGEWHFDPAHRDGVPYRTPAEQQRYGERRPDAAQREQFRGQIDNRTATQRSQTQRPEQRPEGRGGEGRSSAFDGVDRGQQVNRDYDRGRSSWGDRSLGERSGGERGGFHGGGGRR